MRARVVIVPVLVLLAACRGCDARVAAPPHADAAVAPARPDAKRRREPVPAALPDDAACEKGPAIDCFVLVPAGHVAMGAQAVDPAAPGYDADALPHEAPVHDVELPAFRLQRQEVTRVHYGLCVADGWCDAADVEDYAVFAGAEDSPTHAASGLSWQGAARVCAWLGGRLPTEAEWERGARGDGGVRFPWGDDAHCGRMVWTTGGAAPTGETSCAFDGVTENSNLRGESPFGLVGMGGNVWEWTADWYAPDAYATSTSFDPRGPATGTARVQRGGGWSSVEPTELRAAARAAMEPDKKLPDVGVRCARDEVGG